jgi:hypothetical protein
MKPARRPTTLRLEQLEDRTVLSGSNHPPLLTVAPVAPLTVLASGSYLTNQSSVQLQGTTLPGRTVRLETGTDYKFDEGSVVAGPTGHFGLSVPLNEGLNHLKLRVVNGQQVKTVAFWVTRDDQAPTIAFSHPTPGQDISHIPQIRGQLADAYDRITSLQASVDGGPFTAVKLNAGGTFAFFPALPTTGADGTHVVALQATDLAGNQGSASISFVIDTAAPTVTVSQPAQGLVTSQNPTITGQVTDGGSGVAALQVALDGGAYHALTFDGSGNFTFTPNLSLHGRADGTHVVHFLAIDKAGNQTPVSYKFVLDTTAPVVVVKQPGPNLITNQDPTISGKVQDFANDLAQLQVSVDGATATSVTFDSTGHFSFTPTLALDGSADGSHTVTFQATDQAGNQSAATSYTFTLDTVAPTLQSNLDQINAKTIDGVWQGSLITFTTSAPLDPTTLRRRNFTLTGPKGIVPLNFVVSPDDEHVTLSGTGLLPVGSYTFTVNAPAITDLAGNALGSAALTWTFDVSRTYNWTNTAGGDWSNPANWDRGQLPGPYDNAVINVAGNAVITHSQGNDTIADLTSANPIQLTGGVLAVTGTVQVNNTFSLAGGTLRGATVLAGNGGQGITLSTTGGTLDGVTVDTSIDGSQVAGATVTLVNGLRLNNGTIVLGNNDFGSLTNGVLVFANSPGQVGPQTLGGTGTVVLGGSSLNLIKATQGLQIASGITIQGASGTLAGTIINSGIISANVASGIIQLDASSGNDTFVNYGRMDAHNGGSLTATSLTLFENFGVLTAGLFSFDVLNGNFTQGNTGLIRVEEMDGNPADGGNLSVVGSATLAGNFKEVFTNGYVPGSGDGGKVMKWGTYTGSFANVLTSQPLVVGLTLQSTYGAHGFHVVYA